jgi:trimethylamine--corrinoid protein Co-methyltransferase
MELRVLSEEQIRRIHEASLWILGKIGVLMPHTDMRARFREAGASVDEASQLVRIPESLVEQSLAQAGKTFTLYGRDRAKQAVFGKGARNYNSASAEPLWIEDATGERRYPTLADVATAARIGDGLANINIVGAMAEPHELSPQYGSLAVMAEMLRNTSKPLSIFFHNRVVSKFMVEMMIAVAGSEKEASRYPIAYPYLEPISPLRFPVAGIDSLYETARLDLPVPVGPMVQTGVSGPATLAGTVAQENAEVLAGIVVTQLIKPGTPVVFGGVCHAFDMRTTQMIFSGPEQALMAVAMVQVGRSYELPVYVNVGLTDSKRPDAQAGMESGITLACGAMAGAELFGHMGICGVDQGGSLEILVMQDELIGYVNRLVEGFEVDDEHLGLKVVEEVGPGGTFLDQDHTAHHYRDELWFPALLDRQFYAAWESSGGKTMADRCREEKERLLGEHQPEPLPADVDKELERILAGAREELAAEGMDWRAG